MSFRTFVWYTCVAVGFISIGVAGTLAAMTHFGYWPGGPHVVSLAAGVAFVSGVLSMGLFAGLQKGQSTTSTDSR